ncbi:MAG: aldose epimerase family protein [Sporolactobacillus sp.]
MIYTEKELGVVHGERIIDYQLTNDRGTSINCLSAAAAWRDFKVKTASGQLHSLLFHFEDWQDYLTNPFHVGHSIGRVGGRIKDGCFVIDGKRIHVPVNEGPNCLHGGAHGFSFWNWQGELGAQDEAVFVRFHRLIQPKDDGFPGTLEAEITYTLTNTDDVIITFSGISDQPTLFDPMTHVYFNLSDGQDSILDHELAISSGRHVQVDAHKLPTGNLLSNQGTAYDFSQPRALSDALDQLTRETAGTQFDDAFEVMEGEMPSAVVRDPASGRQLTVTSDRNGLVIFTANPEVIGHSKQWEAQHPFNALAIEAQTLPDSIHHPEFGSVILPANQERQYTVRYHYCAIDQEEKK